MLSVPVVVAFLAMAALPQTPPRAPTALSCDQVASWLSMPGAGAYSGEYNARKHALERADYERARDHYQKARERCWSGSLMAEDPQGARAFIEGWKPESAPVIELARQPASDIRRQGTYLLLGTRTVARETSHSDGSAMATNLVFSPTEWISWLEVDGVPQPTSRNPPQDPRRQGYPPIMLARLHITLCRTQFLLRWAEKRGHVILAAERASWVVRMDSWELRRELTYPGPGYPGYSGGEIPGQASFEFSRTKGGWRLTSRWEDCLGNAQADETLQWVDADPMPRECVERTYAPGTGIVINEWITLFSPLDDADTVPPDRWVPQPGEVVYDRRHGSAVQYVIGPDGRDPGSELIAAQAAAQEEGGRAPTVRMVAVGQPEEGIPATRSPPMRIVVWSGAVLVSSILLIWALRRRRAA